MSIKNIQKYKHLILCVIIFTSLLFIAPCLSYSLSIQRSYLQDTIFVQGKTAVSYKLGNCSPSCWRIMPMRNIKKDFHFSVPDPNSKLQRFKTTRLDPQLLSIRQKLMEANLWENPEVQHKFWLGQVGTDKTGRRVRIELLELIERHKEVCMILDDPFMPYASAEQISSGGVGVRILDQAYNNIPTFIDPDCLLTGGVIFGKPGCGKSSAAFNILRQIAQPFLLLDPKACWAPRAATLRAKVIDCLSLDLRPPPNVKWEDWLFAVMEAVAQATGLQYGLDPLIEASQIALAQRAQYLAHTGNDPSLCLKDILLALPLCSPAKSKRLDYRASAETALRLLVGAENNPVFANRSGLPLQDILQERYIIPCPYLNTWQSRFLGLYLFLYMHHASLALGFGETTRLRHLTVIDDSSRFISKPDSIFGSAPKFSAWSHLVKVLRASGSGFLFIDQLVQSSSDDIRQLAHLWLIVGTIQGRDNQDEVAAAMNLSQSQKEYLGHLQTRECVFYCPAAHPKYPYPIHGFIPLVSQPGQENLI